VRFMMKLKALFFARVLALLILLSGCGADETFFYVSVGNVDVNDSVV